ncbi:metalloregulator ArsR/SmtB family transcription factor [Kineobactrum salinum]|uniref:Metalloregulator ArsR/SmtB family transcription factor n=2 Tax=Kineobactrum salinum TaxID=2708301 RepID=A0A6C0U5S1_9GAMM|nr:metalloregulator ArsR/SmtB family transcription factor [Kineobactrum salinum]
MRQKVLFLCTANSARSQMAEALLRQLAGDQFEVFSAGNMPEEIDPRTLATLQSFGIDSGGLVAKSVAELAGQHFDFVITLCSKAHRECRHWPGSGVVMAWDFPDPKQRPEPNAFARTLQEISERIRLFVLVNSKQVQPLPPPAALTFYKALADETRLLSLLLIERAGELCVCELVEALASPQPKVSRHLAQLRRVGLLLDRREGQWVHYRLHPALPGWMAGIIHSTREHSGELLALPLQRLRDSANPPGSRVQGATQ